MLKTLLTFFLLSIAAFCAGQVSSDDAPTRRPLIFWGQFGMGTGGQNYSVTSQFNFKLGKSSLLTAGFDGTDYHRLGSYTPNDNTSGTSSYSLFALAGKMYHTRHALFSISAGPAYCNTQKYTPSVAGSLYYPFHNELKTDAIGLYVNGNAFFLLRPVGIGLNPFVNINNSFTYGGLRLVISAGKFR